MPKAAEAEAAQSQAAEAAQSQAAEAAQSQAAEAPQSQAAEAPQSQAAEAPPPTKSQFTSRLAVRIRRAVLFQTTKPAFPAGFCFSTSGRVAQLSHGRCFLIATLQFKHHPFDVLVVGMRLHELQTLLGGRSSQTLDRFLARPPSVHVTLVRHVEINCIPTRESPAVIFDAIDLPSRK